jgi:hypothetical protein
LEKSGILTHNFKFDRALSADRKVSPGYGFTADPKYGNCISAPPHLPVTPCKNTVFALLRKLFVLLTITAVFKNLTFCGFIRIGFNIIPKISREIKP